MNDMSMDLSDPEIAAAFSGDKVGDECELEDVRLRVKRISASHDDEYGKDGKPTGKKKMNGTISFEVVGFTYGDHEFSADDAKGKSGGGMMGAEAPPAPATTGGYKGTSKPGLVVAIGLGKKK